jgi:hypothetical protein
MTVQCIACAAFRFERGAKNEPTDWAKAGGGKCAHRPEPWVIRSATYDRECGKFAANDEKTVARLRAWLDKQKGTK